MYRARRDSKYRSRNHWQQERHAAPKQPRSRTKREQLPEQVALLEYSNQLRRQRLRGERITDEQRNHYSALLNGYHAALAQAHPEGTL